MAATAGIWRSGTCCRTCPIRRTAAGSRTIEATAHSAVIVEGRAMSDLFPLSEHAREVRERLIDFQRTHVEPAEGEYFAHIARDGQHWTIPPVIERLKNLARAAGLWNLFLPGREHGRGLS